jgi:hypothetical protein
LAKCSKEEEQGGTHNKVVTYEDGRYTNGGVFK